MTTSTTQRTIDAVWRTESAKLIAALTRLVGDVGLAEDLAQDALVAALEQWPDEGIPDNPAAWLMTVAKRRAIDRIRRDKTAERKYTELGRQLEGEQESGEGVEAAVLDEVSDNLLRLLFIACRPILSQEARVSLTLRLIGGLTTEEIGRAFLTPTPTIAQRITRAKRTLAAAQIPFDVPGDERVKPGVLPAGRYASLIYTGSGMKGNKALIGWAQENNIAWDRQDLPEGDAFRCRYEMYLTDYRIEHRKTKWEIELAIKRADE